MRKITVLLIKSRKASLPEINAYVEYFNSLQEFEVDALFPEEIDIKKNYDIGWIIQGLDNRTYNCKLIVHEYASLSTGKFSKIKNVFKKLILRKPDLRIFLNSFVRKEFDFKDDCRYVYRDMGVADYFLQSKNINRGEKKYDFVYIGDITKERQMNDVLKKFANNPHFSILLIGPYDEEYYNEYSKERNIKFMGKISHKDIPKIATNAKYGLNYIPNIYPYYGQTSTKLLEYLALDLIVVTNQYDWINKFEIKTNSKFIKFNDINDLNFSELESYEYYTNFVKEDFLWENLINLTNLSYEFKRLYEIVKEDA